MTRPLLSEPIHADQVIGVCSWSLRPESPEALVAAVQRTGLSAIQLALDPIRTGRWDEARTFQLLRDAGITVRSGMMAMAGEDYTTLETIRRTGGVRSDEHWPANLAAARENAALAARHGLRLVTFHAGFMPEEPADPLRPVMLERLRAVADAFAAAGVRVAFETGQESAAILLEFLEALDRPAVGVNFDPANMILYAKGEPVAALRTLIGRVLQVHIKDALPTAQPGTWGQEVAAASGAVDWPAFFRVLHETGARPDLIIERESGHRRLDDVAAARDLARRLM